MRRNVFACLTLLAVALPLSLAACKRSEQPPAPTPAPAPAPTAEKAPAPAPAPVVDPFRVTGLTVGNAIGPDKQVTSPTSTLAPTDTIYVSVASAGKADSVKLTARWTYLDPAGDMLVSESSETIAPTGPAVTEFHVSKPDGWPAGRYKVEILKDGFATGAQQFEVR
jgi:hypothetical protein